MKRLFLPLALTVLFSLTVAGQPDYKLVIRNYVHEVDVDDGICDAYTYT
jgi:hypothetical protein